MTPISTIRGPMSIDLDHEQTAVAEAAASDRLLVIAGAGQGKTEIVSSRIAYLTTEEGLSATDEVLVLTFSRAAVEAVRRRLTLRDVAEASVRTFDSFASRLLLDAEVDTSSLHGFEARIRRATQLLREEDLPYTVEALQHLILDEVQDLVGDRADFVLALLSRLGPQAGLTALGDPLQGVYDFQLEESKSKTSSTDVFQFLAERLSARRLELSRNYRARGRDAVAVVSLGEQLRHRSLDSAAMQIVENFALTLPDLGRMNEVTHLIGRWSGSSAVLCRTNADALRISRTLSQADVGHALRRPAQEVGASPWISRVFSGAQGVSVDEDDALEWIANTPDAPEPDEAWMQLKAADRDPRRRRTLNLLGLHRSIRANALPLSLTGSVDHTIVVSTVHRAKGLEFDKVVIVRPDHVWETGNTDAEVRLSYVALSRARDDIYQVRPEPLSGFFKRGAGDRWIEKTFAGKKGPRPVAMEFRHHDVEVQFPFSGGTDVTANQNLLATVGLVGRRVTAWLDEAASSPAWPRYLLRVEGAETIATTSEEFGWDFQKVFGRPMYGRNWPMRLTGMTIGAVETVAGEREFAVRSGLGDAGLWLVPRILGLARPDWSNGRGTP